MPAIRSRAFALINLKAVGCDTDRIESELRGAASRDGIEIESAALAKANARELARRLRMDL